VLEGPDIKVIERWNVSQSPVEYSLCPGWLYALRDEATGDAKLLRVQPVEEVYRVEF
jgi:hypothetical protein